jgi:hypothetical protein
MELGEVQNLAIWAHEEIKKHIVQAGHIKAWTLCIYQFNHNFMLQDIHESEHMATTLRYVEIPI